MRALFVSAAFAGMAALTSFLAEAAAAQQGVPSPWVDQLVSQLGRVERALNAEGYARVQGPFTGSLQRERSQRFEITLSGGGDYRVVAVCDSDCRDLDLRLFDQNSNLIAENTDGSDVPIVTSQPRWTGPFSVEVTMAHCAAAPCYYAAYVYGRR